MEFQEFELATIDIVKKLPLTRSRNCFRSAINHIEKAELIAELDHEMAAFRAITAEEEAASGLMFCLQELNYPNAEKLKPHDHRHKNAIAAFLIVLSKDIKGLMDEHGFSFDLSMQRDGSENISVQIRNKELFGDFIITPVLPLDHIATTGDKLRSFTSNINELATTVGVKDILDFIKKEANVRNNLLYANAKGIAILLESPLALIESKRKRILSLQYIVCFRQPCLN